MNRTRSDEYRQYQKEWRAKNRDKINAAYKRHKLKNPEARMHNAARCRANLKGWEFNLEVSDIVIPETCLYLKQPLKVNDPQWAPSLDRIDSSKGYIKGNVQVISKLANLMRSNANEEQLVQFAKSVLEIYNRE